jgi:hypothetical protein
MEAPIWIVADVGAKVVIMRPDDKQNVLNIGQNAPVHHLCLCGVGEAGAYPTSMALIRKWIPLTGRAAWLCGGGANTTHHTASRSRNFHPSSKAMSSEFVAQRTQPRILSDKDVCRISRRRSLTKGGAHPSGGLIANHAFASCSVTSSR